MPHFFSFFLATEKKKRNQAVHYCGLWSKECKNETNREDILHKIKDFGKRSQEKRQSEQAKNEPREPGNVTKWSKKRAFEMSILSGDTPETPDVKP